MTTKFGVVFASLAICFLGLLFPPSIQAATQLFIDNFEGLRRLEWQESLGLNGSWTVLEGYYRASVLKSGPADVPTLSVVGNSDWSDYEFKYKVYGEQGVDKVVYFRYKGINDSFYELNILSDGPNGRIFFCKKVSGIEKICPRSAGFVSGNFTWYDVSISAIGSHINVKINDTTYLDFLDTGTTLPSGKVAVLAWPGAYCGNNCISKVRFDDVEIFGEGTPLSKELFPYFNQQSSQWGDDLYDHADSWNPAVADTSFGRWGCAVTSAAMVMKYHGVNKGPSGQETTPGSLNDWLSGQPDGYLRNGATNWLALTRYAREANQEFPSQTKLEFKRSNNEDFALLDDYLVNQTPPILEEPNELGGRHFIVATNKLPTSYSVNDPFFEEFDTLESYDDSFLGMRTFVPSSTDLSYLLATTEAGQNLSLLSENGAPIADVQTFSENPIGDPLTGEVSGEALNAVSLAKPEDGIYKFVASGDGLSEVDVYAYDNLGNVAQESLNFLLSPGEPEEIVATFDKEDSQLIAIEKSISYGQFLDELQDASSDDLISSGQNKSLSSMAEVAARMHESGNHSTEVIILETMKNLVDRLMDGEIAEVLVDDLDGLSSH